MDPFPPSTFLVKFLNPQPSYFVSSRADVQPSPLILLNLLIFAFIFSTLVDGYVIFTLNKTRLNWFYHGANTNMPPRFSKYWEPRDRSKLYPLLHLLISPQSFCTIFPSASWSVGFLFYSFCCIFISFYLLLFFRWDHLLLFPQVCEKDSTSGLQDLI